MFKLDLEKAEEPEIKLPTSFGSLKKQENSRKKSASALLTTSKPLTVASQQTVENSSRDGNTRPPHLPAEKSVCPSRSNSEIRTWNNRLVPNWERSTSRLYIVNLFILPICRVHHTKCRAGWSTSWKIARRNINNLGYADDTTLMAESGEELKSFLKKVKEEDEKAGWKLSIQENKMVEE